VPNDLVVLVPTRSRPHLVDRMVDAWMFTGANVVADLYFVIDVDDMEYPRYHDEIRKFGWPNMVVLPEWKPLVPKLNRVAVEFADQYKAIAFMGDDHTPRTPMWARMLIEDHMRMSPVQTRIVYGQDGLQDERLPTWWSMDSRIVKALGRMVPSDVQHLYCDNAVKELGQRSRTLFYDERILIEHMHPVAGKGEADAQYRRVNRPQQYHSDGIAFRQWLEGGAERDATLVRSIGG
jgi:hypothetical protein